MLIGTISIINSTRQKTLTTDWTIEFLPIKEDEQTKKSDIAFLKHFLCQYMGVSGSHVSLVPFKSIDLNDTMVKLPYP